MLVDETMQVAARRLGDAIREENGAASAAEKIEAAVTVTDPAAARSR
jgi:UDP:flavonoid glycosyltransferase YjiC (YdhE family)